MILAPNIACIAGVFTMGFGIMTSVLTNNVTALAALANGVLPLRKVAQLEAERQHRLEITQTCTAERNPVPTPPAAPERPKAAVMGQDPVPTPPTAPERRPRRWKETLYRRPLRRPIDETIRQAISTEFARRQHEIPVPAELHWHPEKPQLTIRSKELSFVVHFTREDLVVDAELSLAAKMFATRKHRADAVKIIDSVANDLGL
jgi:hypothetical protein